ncbi:hypothetical protein ZOSMA_397G00060 [Zostera marina]|uniref:LysM domain-containing protein n=1 Tax=Zostera marina TaxID=29655 RepID=A0A0K9P6I7_ZOSMR|nr:hypothetical protein ZOSMA_397G00060 [Zostera marina]
MEFLGVRSVHRIGCLIDNALSVQVRACGRNCHFMSLESDHMEEGCEEMYVVKEGDTLQSISAKCNDPFILEENPFIQQDNDVYPGLVIKITPYYTVD